MTKAEIIEKLEELIEDRESFIDDDPTCDIFRQDAEALREAVKLLSDSNQVKLDRSRWEGCPNCESWSVYGYRNYEPAYCRDCGKPLNEAAWAELENRIGGYK